MKVAQEMLTVFLDSGAREVFIVVAGLRVTLTQDETATLTETLFNGLERLAPKSAAHPQATEIITIGSLCGDVGREDPNAISRDDPQIWPAPAMTGQDADGHDRMRALIKARIRDKGLAIWEENRS